MLSVMSASAPLPGAHWSGSHRYRVFTLMRVAAGQILGPETLMVVGLPGPGDKEVGAEGRRPPRRTSGEKRPVEGNARQAGAA